MLSSASTAGQARSTGAAQQTVDQQLKELGIQFAEGATAEEKTAAAEKEFDRIEKLVQAAVSSNSPAAWPLINELHVEQSRIAELIKALGLRRGPIERAWDRMMKKVQSEETPQSLRQQLEQQGTPAAVSPAPAAPPLKSTARIISGQNQGSTQVVDAMGRSVLQGEQQAP
jgi:hypothetical protein